MNIEFIDAIIEQYASHGWSLRRAVLSDNDAASVGDHLNRSYPDLNLLKGSDSGFWFSRRTLADREAWEFRRLSGSPFALLAVIEDSLSGTEREAILNEVEQRMFSGHFPEPTSH